MSYRSDHVRTRVSRGHKINAAKALAGISMLCFWLCLGCAPSDKHKVEEESLSIHMPIWPVLINKKDNPILRIDLPLLQHATSSTPMKFFFEVIQGTEMLQELALYDTDSLAEFDRGQLISATDGIGRHVQLTATPDLAPGQNYIWLAATLSSGSHMDKKLDIRCTGIQMGEERVEQSDQETTSKRVGIALRDHNDEGVHTYRIPGLVTTNKGTLIAVYDTRRNGSVDLQEDVDIGMSRSTDGGLTWSPMEIILDMGTWGGKSDAENGVGDPSILVDRISNTIWVAGIWAHGHPGERNWFASKQGLSPKETSQFVLVKSQDDGLTWSKPINITRQIKDPRWHLLLQGPGKGITMKDGTLVFPAQYKDHEEMPHSCIIYSKDHGNTWQIGSGAKSNTTEAQVVELKNGSLMLNMRDNRGSGPNGRNGEGARSVATSQDLGMTWVEHPTSRKALPEPVCMASLIRYEGSMGDMLLFSNPFDTRVRKNITIKISKDEGMTWPASWHTLIDEGRGRGYSCLTMIDESTVGILYEGSQADLVFQRLSLDELLD
ncbi:MAG: exo-alpha-sialidase [Saprospiraceae bacterium]|nr:exo-alpha-sialidase [Saprospiraceae bacterium]